MTVKTNTAEGLTGATDGLAVTGSLTAGGGDQITIAGTSSRWTLRTGGMHGTYCYRCSRNSGASNENPVMLYTLTTNQGNFVTYFKVSVLPTVSSNIIAYSNATGSAATFWLTPSGSIEARNTAAALVGTVVAGIVPDVWYRIETGVVVGTTTANGTIRLSVGFRDRTTPIAAAVVSSTTNTGTTALTNVQWGAPAGSTSAAFNEFFDDPRLDDATSAFSGAHGYSAVGTARFDAVLSNPGNLTASTDFVADLQDNNASTGVTSPGTSTNEYIEYNIPPLSPGSFTGSFKAFWLDGANSMRITLRQGSTPAGPGTAISTRLYALTNTEATYSYSNSGPENALVSDWNDLSAQVFFNAS